jgi:signal transduction histidine kinase
MRSLLMELRPAALLDASLEDLLRQLAEAVIGREGIQVQVNIEGKSNLPCDVHIALYRIAQEAINNVVKHARASQATIHLRYLSASHADEFSEDLEGVVMTVRDDGRGFDPEQVTPDHLGLRIMRERAQAIGATLTVESQPGHGSQITVLWEQETQQIQS